MSGRACFLLLFAAMLALAGPVGAEPLSRESAQAPTIEAAPAPAPPAPGVSSRLVVMATAGAVTSAVGLVLIGVLAGSRRLVRRPVASRRTPPSGGAPRWWRRWLPARAAEADRIEMLSRIHLGSRELLAVVRVGRERLLVGVTPGRISLLSRLERTAVSSLPSSRTVESGPEVSRPEPSPRPLAAAAAPTAVESEPDPVPSEDFASTLAEVRLTVPRTSQDLRAALERSRERLERLSGRRLVEKGPRG